MTSAKPLSEIIDPSWARALAPVEPTVHEIGERLRQEVASGVGYLPAGTDVLRAFTYPMEDVRILIVGQDPYPTPGHPMGLSFSLAPLARPSVFVPLATVTLVVKSTLPEGLAEALGLAEAAPALLFALSAFLSAFLLPPAWPPWAG